MVGTHRGGFSRFRFDVTGDVTPGADNVIAVQVSNAAVNDVPPLDADFTFFGGLYRDVHVLITDPRSRRRAGFRLVGRLRGARRTSPPTQRHAEHGRARAQRSARRPRRSPSTPWSCAPTARRGAAVGAGQRRGGGVERCRRPRRSRTRTCGTASPTRTSTPCTPRSASAATVTDVVSVPLGFRSFAVDAAQGFSLNGQYLDLHGVNRHQDRLNMGWAITDAAARRGHGADPRDGRQRRPPVALPARRALSRPRRPRRHRGVGGDPAGQRHHRLDRVHRQRPPAADRADSPELQPPVDRVLGHRQRAAHRQHRDQHAADRAEHAGAPGGPDPAVDLRAVLHQRHRRAARAHRRRRLQHLLRLVRRVRHRRRSSAPGPTACTPRSRPGRSASANTAPAPASPSTPTTRPQPDPYGRPTRRSSRTWCTSRTGSR